MPADSILGVSPQSVQKSRPFLEKRQMARGWSKSSQNSTRRCSPLSDDTSMRFVSLSVQYNLSPSQSMASPSGDTRPVPIPRKNVHQFAFHFGGRHF